MAIENLVVWGLSAYEVVRVLEHHDQAEIEGVTQLSRLRRNV